jgi:hypothetical protein
MRERGGAEAADRARQSDVDLPGIGPALAGLWTSFSRWAGFSRSEAGFFRLGLFREILGEMFFDLGANWKIKSSILAKIQGIGARKFVEM